MTNFVSRYPIWSSILAVFAAITGIALLDVGMAYLGVPALTRRLTIEIIFCGYVAFLLSHLGWWHEAGFKRPAATGKLFVSLPLLFLPAVVFAAAGIHATGVGQIILFAIFTLMVGFAEEGLLRGLVLRALAPGGLGRAVLLSSFLFGASHLINIFQGAAPVSTIVQVVYAFLLGVSFAAARLYVDSIWPIIAVHALIDFVDLGSRGFSLAPLPPVTLAGAIVTIGITSLYALYGWWLFKRVKKTDG